MGGTRVYMHTKIEAVIKSNCLGCQQLLEPDVGTLTYMSSMGDLGTQEWAF